MPEYLEYLEWLPYLAMYFDTNPMLVNVPVTHEAAQINNGLSKQK